MGRYLMRRVRDANASRNVARQGLQALRVLLGAPIPTDQPARIPSRLHIFLSLCVIFISGVGARAKGGTRV